MIRSISKFLTATSTQRGIISVIVFLVFWEVCSRFNGWFGITIP
jgi:hypothetical protein